MQLSAWMRLGALGAATIMAAEVRRVGRRLWHGRDRQVEAFRPSPGAAGCFDRMGFQPERDPQRAVTAAPLGMVQTRKNLRPGPLAGVNRMLRIRSYKMAGRIVTRVAG